MVRPPSTDELEGKEVSGPTSFYKVYEPVFERNKRFAVILPAPSLGDDDTPIDEVRRHVCRGDKGYVFEGEDRGVIGRCVKHQGENKETLLFIICHALGEVRDEQIESLSTDGLPCAERRVGGL